MFQEEYPEVENQVISSTKSVIVCCIMYAMPITFYTIMFCKIYIMNIRWVLELNFSKNILTNVLAIIFPLKL